MVSAPSEPIYVRGLPLQVRPGGRVLTLARWSAELFAGFASAVAVTTALFLSVPSAVSRTSI